MLNWLFSYRSFKRWAEREGEKNANYLGLLVALAAAAGTIFGLLLLRGSLYWTDTSACTVVILLVLGGGPGLVASVWLLVRPLPGLAAIPTGVCARCRRPGFTSAARYGRVIGVLHMIFVYQLKGFLCRRCSLRTFLVTTAWTLGTGWLSVSVFLVPGLVLLNTAMLARSLVCSADSRYGRAQTARVLDGDHDYVVALLDGKDVGTVVDVVARKSRLPPLAVAGYIDRLPRSPGTSLRESP